MCVSWKVPALLGVKRWFKDGHWNLLDGFWAWCAQWAHFECIADSGCLFHCQNARIFDRPKHLHCPECSCFSAFWCQLHWCHWSLWCCFHHRKSSYPITVSGHHFPPRCWQQTFPPDHHQQQSLGWLETRQPWQLFGCELREVGAQSGMVVSQLLEPEQVDVKRGLFPRHKFKHRHFLEIFRYTIEVCQSVSSPSGFLLTSFDSDYIAPFPLFTFWGVKQNDIEHSQIQDPFLFIHGYPLWYYQYCPLVLLFLQLSKIFQAKLVTSLRLSALLEWPVEPVLL